ncbi:MAG: hypothetical protein HYT16_01185 [DPANN group archaeon]|nr:hypothetical protein [DPANN group archaeon]
MTLGETLKGLFRSETPYQLKQTLVRAQREADKSALGAKRSKQKAYEAFKEAVRTNAGEKAEAMHANMYDRAGRMELAAGNIRQYSQNVVGLVDLAEQYVGLLGTMKGVVKVSGKLKAKTGNIDALLGDAEQALRDLETSGQQVEVALEGLSNIGQSEPTEDLVARLKAQASAEIAQETVGVTSVEQEIAKERQRDEGNQGAR